jgi:hypothetical protein
VGGDRGPTLDIRIVNGLAVEFGGRSSVELKGSPVVIGRI